MKRFGLIIVFVFPLSLLATGLSLAADDSKVKAATEQVERGAKKIPDGKIGEPPGATRAIARLASGAASRASLRISSRTEPS